ncbi:hypothetical protein NDU88_000144 [Pleurodeles waltl]|uniref:Uncharacterized protein n=1 Tax=Pleurodeles waltl TaxID=8319 RepID=A0AAV7L7P6_PLEWA|nr:hypothetical protein NDU88_000144 [Pleurodeles waltl]
MRNAACATSTTRLFAAALRRSSYPALPACTPLLRAQSCKKDNDTECNRQALNRNIDRGHAAVGVSEVNALEQMKDREEARRRAHGLEGTPSGLSLLDDLEV